MAILARELESRSQAGDAVATRVLSDIYEQCWVYAKNPAGFQSNRDIAAGAAGTNNASVLYAYDNVATRCKGFVGQELGPKKVMDTLSKASEQGDLAAEVELFGLLSQQHPGSVEAFNVAEQKDLIARVATSKDPAAYAAAAQLMGPGALSRVTELEPYPAGSLTSEAAWRLAACRLGAPCGANSQTLISACAFGGICGFSSVQSMYMDGMLPKSEANRLNASIDRILKGVQ